MKMPRELQKERVKKYGSFLFCPERKTLCFGMDTPDGICKKEVCCLDDPEYTALQKRIEENRKRNYEKQQAEAVRKREEAHMVQIRYQNKTKEELLEVEIAKKESYARQLYRSNKPNRGDNVMREVMLLQAQVRKVKGARP